MCIMIDSRGVCLEHYKKLLPKRVAEWEPIKWEGYDREMRAKYWLMPSFLSGRRSDEVHHIMYGMRNRKDYATNLIPVTTREHIAIHSGAITLAMVLAAKWMCDRDNVDWVLLARIRRQHLPSASNVLDELRKLQDKRGFEWRHAYDDATKGTCSVFDGK